MLYHRELVCKRSVGIIYRFGGAIRIVLLEIGHFWPRLRIKKRRRVKRFVIRKIWTSQWHPCFYETRRGQDAVHTSTIVKTIRTPQRWKNVALLGIGAGP